MIIAFAAAAWIRLGARRWVRTVRPVALGLGWLFIGQAMASAADRMVLWQVGLGDDRNAEFALAPQGYQRFTEDGFFVVGRSDPKVDWPYVHPGPADAWAGGRSHSFAVVFSAKTVATEGNCSLVLDLLDTQSSMPPRLEVSINGTVFGKDLPAGAGDASVYGDPAHGREHRWSIEFPARLLRSGDNEVVLTTRRGSWFLYDGISLEVPPGFELTGETRGTRIVRVDVPPVWRRDGDTRWQPIQLTLRHAGDEEECLVYCGDREVHRGRLRAGMHALELRVPAEDREAVQALSVKVGGREAGTTNVTVRPPKIRDVWVLAHSHVDVGYTHLQDEIVRIQIDNLERAMLLARQSADRPPGMRFKWNPEAIWAIDHFLRRATPEKREAFLAAVRRGEIGVDALYGNMLTGLCRPEELLQSLAFAPKIAELTGVPVVSAAICDVPGWTWGIVPAMAQAGVKYFAIGPNHSARIGTIHQWDNRPFYWRSQAGRERVLCWVVDNYHHLGDLEQHVRSHAEQLASGAFPYDMSFIYWVGTWPEGGVDNAPPDAKLVEKVTAWNDRYAAPRVVIALASEFFGEFERRHGARVPEVAGDLTPYWEDGAGSTALETALNRESAERLSQADTLFAMLRPRSRPSARFEEAWKNVLLYSEHTWGAHNSTSEPDLPFVRDQWRIKQAFALDASRQSHELLIEALAPDDEPRTPVAAPKSAGTATAPDFVDVFNTTQWKRTDLVRVPGHLSPAAIQGVVDDRGRPLPSQRLASGELAFLAVDVPGFGARRFGLVSEPTAATARRAARFADGRLVSSELTVELDPASGAIRSLRRRGGTHEFVDPGAPVALNDFRYVLGTNAAGAFGNGPVRFEVLEDGPLVVTVRIHSDAPGCRRLTRDVRLVEGLDRVDLVNHVDRLPVREKDAVHFGFGFHVPGGTVRMETPWAVVRPNADQLPGACRNWFTVQRWVDVSNDDLGITWAPVDAPLIEIGGMTANLLGAVGYDEWLDEAIDSTTLYSWAQNNHWFTNYKADQPGVTVFRYSLRPRFGGRAVAEAARFGLESARPLIVTPARDVAPPSGPLLTLSTTEVMVETLKPSDDGRALITRLFGVSGRDRDVRLRWAGNEKRSVWLTDLTEKRIQPVSGRVRVPAHGLVSLRVE